MTSNANSNHVSQCQRMIRYMEEFGSITTLEAVLKLGILSPTKRISEIQKRFGIALDKETITVTNRYGEDVRIRRYSIRKEKTDETI